MNSQTQTWQITRIMTPSVNTKRRFIVTLKTPDIKTDFGKHGNSTVTWNLNASTREFEGEIRYYVSEWGHLSIQNTDFEARTVCLFAQGQWVSIDEVSVNTKRSI
jgi:hypothetical protein